MTYRNCIVEYIRNMKPGEPIYTACISDVVESKFNIEKSKASAATSVAVKRILDKKEFENLRFYKKGIYYLTEKTAFGEIQINKESLIQNKYLLPDIGYETGYNFLNRIGLSSQVPAKRVIATNNASDSIREDVSLGVFVKRGKTKINSSNKLYLQLLDAIELFDKAPLDEKDLYSVIFNHIQSKNLELKNLIAIADRYYSKNTVLRLAHIISENVKL